MGNEALRACPIGIFLDIDLCISFTHCLNMKQVCVLVLYLYCSYDELEARSVTLSSLRLRKQSFNLLTGNLDLSAAQLLALERSFGNEQAGDSSMSRTSYGYRSHYWNDHSYRLVDLFETL